jgi:hypothetical protein
MVFPGIHLTTAANLNPSKLSALACICQVPDRVLFNELNDEPTDSQVRFRGVLADRWGHGTQE